MSEQQQKSQQTNMIVMFLTGRLATAPKVRTVGEQTFCTLAVRANYAPYVDRQGNTVRPKPFDIDCELVGAMAQNAAKHLITGQAVEIVGEPRTRDWKDPKHAAEANPEGRRFKTELFVRTINYGSKPQSYWQNQGTAAAEQAQVEGGTPAQPAGPSTAEHLAAHDTPVEA